MVRVMLVTSVVPETPMGLSVFVVTLSAARPVA